MHGHLNVSVLVPAGPVQACNGIALPLHTKYETCRQNFTQLHNITFYGNPFSVWRVKTDGQPQAGLRAGTAPNASLQNPQKPQDKTYT
jgi:hypothetical protein